MADTSNLSNYLKDVADAIRAKKGTEGAIPAANFDTEIASITTSENLDDVLQEQTALITELEEILKTKSKPSSEPNVFMQETEPEVKEGIWIADEKIINSIQIFENKNEIYGQRNADISISLPFSFSDYFAVTSFNDDIYFFGGMFTRNLAYKYNIKSRRVYKVK